MHAYSYAAFFRTLAAAAFLGLLIAGAGRVEVRKKERLPAGACVAAAALFLCLWALRPLCPFPNAAAFLRAASAASALLCAAAAACWISAGRSRGRSGDFEAFGAAIVDTLRERLVVLDSRRRVVAGEGNPLRRCGLAPGFPAALPEEERFSALRRAIAAGTPAAGELEADGIPYAYRFGPLAGNRGFYATFLDVSQERALIDSLKERRELLLRRKALLEAAAGAEEARLRMEAQDRAAARMQGIVEGRLIVLRQLIEEQAGIDTIIDAAEESMAEIRKAVSALAPRRRPA